MKFQYMANVWSGKGGTPKLVFLESSFFDKKKYRDNIHEFSRFNVLIFEIVCIVENLLSSCIPSIYMSDNPTRM